MTNPTTLPAGPHITQLFAENVKRLKAVRIVPDPEGHLVQITGPNDSGKSSVLDSIFWALGGTKGHEAMPIRKGEDSARIELSLGPVTVTRKFSEKGTTLAVTSADGARFPSPQRLLDELLGTLTFDPLAFDRMPAKERLGVLRQIVPLSIDPEQLDRLNAADYAERTEVGRRARQVEAELDALGPVVPDAPEVDTASIIERITSASTVNADIERERAARARTTQEIEQSYAAAEQYRKEAERLTALADLNVAHAKEKAAALAALPELPFPTDTAELAAALTVAQETNAAIQRNRQRLTLAKQAEALTAEVNALTVRMQAREAEKAKAIAEAPMPVPGLAFGDGDVLFNGIPYDQASNAQRIRVSMAIAMSTNPRLRIILIKNGSLLDSASLALVAQMAAEHDYQVWIEQVDTSGTVGIVMEDGEVKAVVA